MLRIGEARRAGHIGGVLIALVLGADALALYLNVDRMWGFDARGSGQVGSCTSTETKISKRRFRGIRLSVRYLVPFVQA